MHPTATRRLLRDYAQLQQNPLPYVRAHPSQQNCLEWHFILLGPPNTPYHGGTYHGRLLFPETYPMAGPSIIMYTPSGRFKPGERICTTMSDFHPHAWSTLWNVGTILEGLLSFMCEESGGAVGSISASEEERKRFAASSMAWNERHPRFRDEFPEEIRAYREMLARQAEEAAAAAAAAASAMNSHSNLHGGNASRGDPSLQASRGNAHGSPSTMREKENHNSFVHFVLFCFICFFIIWMT